MNLYEYQAKRIINKYGVKIPQGKVAYTPREAKKAASEVSSRGPWVLKAQVHSGARKKGHFLEKSAGKGAGIREVTRLSQIIPEAEQMLRSTLVTPQTGKDGKVVTRLYVEAFCKVKKIFYTGLVIDRVKATITLLVANLEDVDITEIAAKNPEQILRLQLDSRKGTSASQVKQVAEFLGISESKHSGLKKYLQGLFKTFIESDALMLEINPAGIDTKGEIIALDAKLSIDDKAMYRQPDFVRLRDECETDKRELVAWKNGFQYNSFNGSIGCIVNGEGVALDAMDLIQSKGGATACFINVKGGVDRDKIAAGIKLIMTNPKVEGILITVLGGFSRCNLVADGIIAVASEVGLNVPLVVRFEGTNKEEAETILINSHLPVIIAQDIEDAVDKLLKAMEEND